MLAVAALPEVDLATAVIGNPLTVQYGNVSRDVYVYSSNEQLPAIHHWPLALGRFFNAGEDHSLAPVVVLGHKARQMFFRDEPNPLGRQLLIGDAPFEVIGVMAEKGKESGADYYDEMVFIPYQAGRARVYQDILELDVLMDHGWIKTLGNDEEAKIQMSFAKQGGNDTEVPDLSIEVDNVDEIYGKMKNAGFEITYRLTN